MTRKTDKVDLEFTLLPEIRQRIQVIEAPYLKGPSEDGVLDLMDLRDSVGEYAFRAYLDIKRELEALT